VLAVVIVSYVKAADEVNRVLDAHRAWIHEHAAAGTILLSGRRSAGGGGVFVVQADSAAAATAFAATDPFAAAGVAKHEVYDFEAKAGALLGGIARR